jgi:hypothetical protein
MRFLVLIFIITLTLAYFGLNVIPACDDNTAYTCYDLHRDIMSHTAIAPYRYRVLAPLLVNLIGAQDNGHFLASYFTFQIVQFALFFVGLHQWLKHWADERSALMGGLITALTFPLMYRFYWYAPYTSLEASLLVWALVYLSCTKNPSPFIYGALVILASLNRETGLLLVGVYWAMFDFRRWRELVVFAALWGVVTLALHLALGAATPQFGGLAAHSI